MRGLAVLLVAVAAVAANKECPSDWSENKLLVHKDCNKFFMCTYGEPVEMTCWGDLFFNIENGQCDWQENVDCGDRNIPVKEITTTSEPETEPTTAKTTAKPTTAKPTTAKPTTAEPTTAEPTTAEPTTARPTTAKPTTARPTTARPTTAKPTTARPTTAKPTTTRPKPTTTKPTTAEPSTPEPGFLENGCPEDPHKHWLLPVEGDCNGFYYCVWGELVLRACPPTLYFNPVIQVCDWPTNVDCTTSLDKHNIGQYSQRY